MDFAHQLLTRSGYSWLKHASLIPPLLRLPRPSVFLCFWSSSDSLMGKLEQLQNLKYRMLLRLARIGVNPMFMDSDNMVGADPACMGACTGGCF